MGSPFFPLGPLNSHSPALSRRLIVPLYWILAPWGFFPGPIFKLERGFFFWDFPPGHFPPPGLKKGPAPQAFGWPNFGLVEGLSSSYLRFSARIGPALIFACCLPVLDLVIVLVLGPFQNVALHQSAPFCWLNCEPVVEAVCMDEKKEACSCQSQWHYMESILGGR